MFPGDGIWTSVLCRIYGLDIAAHTRYPNCERCLSPAGGRVVLSQLSQLASFYGSIYYYVETVVGEIGLAGMHGALPLSRFRASWEHCATKSVHTIRRYFALAFLGPLAVVYTPPPRASHFIMQQRTSTATATYM